MNAILNLLSDHLLALIVGTLLGSEIMRFLYRPNVLILLKEVMPMYSDGGFFLSVLVANAGRTVAANSVGNITINYPIGDLIDPDQYSLDASEQSLPTYRLENIKLDYPRHQLITPDKSRYIKNSSLCWSSLGNPSRVDINPGSSESLEICRVQLYEDKRTNQKFWYLIFPCEQGWRKVRCRIKLNPNVEITGKLFICPNNVFPTVRTFTIKTTSVEDRPALIIKNYSMIERFINQFNRNKLYFD